jgi:SNF2 family DNA or RNA helicase
MLPHCSGTPLQNDCGELLNLLRFLMPSLFYGEDTEPLMTDQELSEHMGKDAQVCGVGWAGVFRCT